VSSWQVIRDHFGLAKCDIPVPMAGDGFGLLGDSNGESWKRSPRS
jgi:hypothetical protein